MINGFSWSGFFSNLYDSFFSIMGFEMNVPISILIIWLISTYVSSLGYFYHIFYLLFSYQTAFCVINNSSCTDKF